MVGRNLDCVTNQSEQPQNATSATANPADRPKLGGRAIKDILLYGVFRLLLFIVLTFIIHSVVILLGMAEYFPLLISMVLALLVALPLSMLIFKKQRVRATTALADWDSGRREHKQQMRRQLEDRFDS